MKITKEAFDAVAEAAQYRESIINQIDDVKNNKFSIYISNIAQDDNMRENLKHHICEYLESRLKKSEYTISMANLEII